MLKSEDRVIGEHTYRVTQLPVSKGRRLLAQLFKVLGPSIGELAKDARPVADPSLGSLGRGTLADAVRAFADRLEPELLDVLSEQMAAQTQLVLNGGARVIPFAPELEFHFAGRYDEMFQWIGFALEVNFGSFFHVLRDGVAQMGLRKEAPATP